MDWTTAIERLGEPAVLAMCGALVGLGFGFFGQRSKFCLRAAVIEFWHHKYGDKLAVWLLAFATAVVGVQLMVLLGGLDLSSARQLSARGSLSGAAIGGALFGMGMILARGCSSRLLVLAAQGNLRSLLSGLIFAVTAQASMNGILSPWREALAGLWTIDGGDSRDLLAILGWSHTTGLIVGGVWLLAALYFTTRTTQRGWMWVGGVGTGLSVARSGTRRTSGSLSGNTGS